MKREKMTQVKKWSSLSPRYVVWVHLILGGILTQINTQNPTLLLKISNSFKCANLMQFTYYMQYCTHCYQACFHFVLQRQSLEVNSYIFATDGWNEIPKRFLFGMYNPCHFNIFETSRLCAANKITTGSHVSIITQKITVRQQTIFPS